MYIGAGRVPSAARLPTSIRRTTTSVSTALSAAAATIGAGQCRKLSTTLLGSTLIFGSEGANFIQWGVSAYYDPVRDEVGFIGKRDGTEAYHWLVYDEAGNSWSNSRALWSSGTTLGHGYDQNTIDPATGDVYFRDWDNTIRKYSGSWTSFSGPTTTEVAGGLAWFPGVGLCYADGRGLQKYSDGSWSALQTRNDGSYHDFAEYNSTANVLIFGGGNSSAYYKCTSGGTVTSIASPPYTLGSAASGPHGLVVSDPNSDRLIAWNYGTDWRQYDIGDDAWTTLTQSSGDGSSPQTGLPNLSAGASNSVVVCPVPDYGVILFIQYLGSGSTPAGVWVYKHG